MSALLRRWVSALIRASTAIVMMAAMTPSVVRAQSGAWNTVATTGGSWGNVANWQGGMIASGSGNTATFALDFTAGASVTLDGSRTIGTVSTTSANPWSLDPGTGGTLTVAGFNVSGAGPLAVTAPLAGVDFAKDGAGTLVLSSPGSSYAGNININAGTLALTGAGNYSTASNTVHVASGATLDVSQLTSGFRYGGDPSTRMSVNSGDTVDGTGTVNGGLKVSAGGTVYAGVDGVGTLSVKGNGDFSAGSNWKVKLSTANPGPVNTSNVIDFTATLKVADQTNMPIDGSGLTYAAGQTFDYVIGNTSNANLGAVNFQPTNFLPASFNSPSYFSLFENGNNVVLQFTPVPEPTFGLAFVGGVTGAFFLRSRRARLGPRT